MNHHVARGFPVLASVLAAIAFLPALGAGFLNWDDEAMLLRSHEWRGLGPSRLRWMLTTTFFGHWSPIAWLTWGANYAFGGLDPWGYHLVNLLLHAINAGLFYLVAQRLYWSASSPPEDSAPPVAIAGGALVAALAFGTHPLRVESVAWVSERRDVLCCMFYLLSVLAYLRGVSGEATIVRRWHALSLAAFAGALMSKAIAFTLPLSLLVLDVYPLRRLGLGWWALVKEKLPYLALGAGAAALALAVRHGTGNITDYEQYSPLVRLVLVGYSLWFYSAKLVWPAGLSPMYELPVSVQPSDWRFMGPLLGSLAVTVALVILRRRWPAGLAAWLHSAIVLLPISGVVHSGSQLVGDRYSYLSGLGVALAAGGAVTWGLGRARGERRRFWPSVLVAAASVAVVAALMTASWAQSRLWHDSETLWRAAVRLDPGCSICESNLGRALIQTGRLAEAEDHVRRAMALRPERPGPVENLGVIMLTRGRYADAEEYFRRIVAKRPDSGMYRNSLAVAIANQGRSVEAEAEFQLARRLDPRLIDGHANLGLLYVRQGRYAEAIAPLSRALAIDASHGPARANLARALRARSVELVREGKVDEGARRWQEASAFAGDDPALLAALGQALVEQGRGAEAIAVLERAVKLNPKAARERLWLARAYRIAGRVEQADQEAAALRALAPALAAELGR